jgi:DNA-directed RNA polymerase subunit RPC12/RpoP
MTGRNALVASQTPTQWVLAAVTLVAGTVFAVHYLAPTLVNATLSDAFALVALLSLFSTGYLITCPNCHLRLIFHAMTHGASWNWLHWVLNVEECPRCGHRSSGRI